MTAASPSRTGGATEAVAAWIDDNGFKGPYTSSPLFPRLRLISPDVSALASHSSLPGAGALVITRCPGPLFPRTPRALVAGCGSGRHAFSPTTSLQLPTRTAEETISPLAESLYTRYEMCKICQEKLACPLMDSSRPVCSHDDLHTAQGSERKRVFTQRESRYRLDRLFHLAI